MDLGAGTMTINREHDDRVVEVRMGGRHVSTNLRKVGAFLGDRAIVGSGHSLAPGSIIGQGEVVPNNITYRNT
ncbi:MAG: hypothetical protein WCI61_09630 [Chloroflexota bacterium]